VNAKIVYEFRRVGGAEGSKTALCRCTVMGNMFIDVKAVATFDDDMECMNFQRFVDDGGTVRVDPEMALNFESERILAARRISPQAEEQAKLDNERRRKERGK
jgi:hypothetical protein